MDGTDRSFKVQAILPLRNAIAPELRHQHYGEKIIADNHLLKYGDFLLQFVRS